MKLTIWKLLIAFLMHLTLCSCKPYSVNATDMNLTIKLLGNPDCNRLKSVGITGSTPNSQSCIEYSFDPSAKKIVLKHLNAGFNCCPESLYCTVTFRNDTIIIQEFEKSMSCKCNCLYELDMEVNGVEPGEFQIRLIEPYAGNQDKLNFGIDLLKKKQGTSCVNRFQYPRGE